MYFPRHYTIFRKWSGGHALIQRHTSGWDCLVGPYLKFTGAWMLILTRKQGESVAIGDDIQVTVVEIQGKQVKLGVKAPREVSVHRQEIYEKIQQENIRASQVQDLDLSELRQVISSEDDKKDEGRK